MEDAGRNPRATPIWRMLEEGRFRFQRCARCSHAWLPPAGGLPLLLVAASGAGRTPAGAAS